MRDVVTMLAHSCYIRSMNRSNTLRLYLHLFSFSQAFIMIDTTRNDWLFMKDFFRLILRALTAVGFWVRHSMMLHSSSHFHEGIIFVCLCQLHRLIITPCQHFLGSDIHYKRLIYQTWDCETASAEYLCFIRYSGIYVVTATRLSLYGVNWKNDWVISSF